MEDFRLSQLSNSSILYVYAKRETIFTDPDYQRPGDIWNTKRRQLLIDSILNGYDIPKFYFHEFMPSQVIAGKHYKYSIIDGKQRLTSIWQFIDGKFNLSDDFVYLEDESIKASGMSYADISLKYPILRTLIDGYTLSIVTIQTENLDRIEDMFYRLNEAEPLNAAEKRNAIGGTVSIAIRALANDRFFTENIRFKNSRYQYLDLATKFMFIEYKNGFVNTKRSQLDEFVKNLKDKEPNQVSVLETSVKQVLSRMASVFQDNDHLLRHVGIATLYYYVFRTALNNGWDNKITRQMLVDFEDRRRENRLKAERDESGVDFDLIKFDSYSQSLNDSTALEFRHTILMDYLEKVVMK